MRHRLEGLSAYFLRASLLVGNGVPTARARCRIPPIEQSKIAAARTADVPLATSAFRRSESASVHGLFLRGRIVSDRLATVPRHFAILLPKLDVVAVDELFGSLDGGAVIRATQVNGLNEPAENADDINAIIVHCTAVPIRRERKNSQSPIDAKLGR